MTAWTSAEQSDKHEAEDGGQVGMMEQEEWGEEWGRTLQHVTRQALLREKANGSSEMARSSGVSWPAETRSLALKLSLSVRCVSAANSKKIGNP